jgi:AcrR family transcriptional regulator
MSQSLSRRERTRAATLREIKETARRVLVQEGSGGLALRAVAREMGVTAPALYRYFTGREELVEHVVADLYDELTAELEAARDATVPATPAVQLMAVCRAFREWATTRRAEFGLLFGSAGDRPVAEEAAPAAADPGPAALAASRFGGVFAALVAQIYLTRPFPVPAEESIAPELREQLVQWSAHFPVQLPTGVLSVFLSCWIRIYGTVCMEVFGHLRFALDDAEPLFEAELLDLAGLLGIADEVSTARG